MTEGLDFGFPGPSSNLHDIVENPFRCSRSFIWRDVAVLPYELGVRACQAKRNVLRDHENYPSATEKHPLMADVLRRWENNDPKIHLSADGTRACRGGSVRGVFRRFSEFYALFFAGPRQVTSSNLKRKVSLHLSFRHAFLSIVARVGDTECAQVA